ncbi:uncharacterized protein [Leptinotarsa decemlineata]|uniref:uncharacterized protein n=1 Tax=Leptinotarsa decemlineata TaxID=7539 RepID=UPI000C252CE7|nr:uncharacterized protein LOC111506311 [Leptinotarsa decemlineata]
MKSKQGSRMDLIKNCDPDLLEKIRAVQKKKLKVVIYKNKFFPDKLLEEKTQLVRTLLRKEREIIDAKEDMLDSEEENAIADQLRTDLLNEKINKIYDHNDLPVTTQKYKRKEKEQRNSIPTISNQNLNRFFKLLGPKKALSSREKALKDCLDHMHTSAKPLWTSPSTIMKAINDCILTRNFNNLTELLLFLIHLRTDKYKPLIRHLCQILDKLHPVIQDNDLQGQLKLVQKAVRRKQ